MKIETGLIARQADGAVVVTYGETSVLCTATFQKSQKPGIDFFPLTVNYQEKSFAAGKIPGGYFKREGRPSEKETLTSRLIDRPIRPLFLSGFRNEVQVVCTVISHDMENDPDIVAMIGASAALTISGAPFLGPIGAARIGYINGEYVLNPSLDEIKESQLDLVVAGTNEGVLMVESEAHELSEEIMLGAVTEGHKHFQDVIDMIIDLAEDCAKEPYDMPAPDERIADINQQVAKLAMAGLQKAYAITSKQQRVEAISLLKDEVKEKLLQSHDGDDIEAIIGMIGNAFKECEKNVVRGNILKTGGRIDGRDTRGIRQIDCRVGIIDKSHGSSLFTRGETQALVSATLGTSQDEQMIDALDGDYRENFMLHYNFPPYSVGEVGRMGTPGRREIGHGKLAWRAIRPLLPSKEDFPYTLRVVSEITESNGSSSMATVCGTSLALMDAGVPLKKSCAGIAMGLIQEGKEFAVLSDILGDEDHLGDMDFKVAGTNDGVTSLQMDIKITSITPEIMQQALEQAKEGRLHILNIMKETISTGRTEISNNAPRITSFQINKDKIRDVIGTGGKVIREIVEVTGAKVDIDDDGTIMVSSVDENAAKAAIDWIRGITDDPEEGRIYKGVVAKITDFGAFVTFMPNRDGLVHISEIADDRIASVQDVLEEGQEIYVKFLGMDDRGKVRLSMRMADQETGEEREVEAREQRPRNNKSGGERDNNRRPKKRRYDD